MKKKFFLSALFSIFGLFLYVSTAHAGTYTYKNIYTVSITTTAADAKGTVTLPKQSNGLQYTATLYITTDPNSSCLPDCLYYKEVIGINKTTTETFNIKGLDPSRKYYFIVSDTSKKHSLEFQVDGIKTFTATSSTTNISATLTGLRSNTNNFRLLVLNRPFEAADIKKFMLGGIEETAALPLHSGADVVKKPGANGEILWNLGNFLPGTTYYARVIEYSDRTDPSSAFYTTEQKTVTTGQAAISPDQLLFEYKDATALIKGRVNPSTNPNFSKYTITIQFSKEPFSSFTTTNPPAYGVYKTHDMSVKDEGIASDGTYHLFVPNLSLDTPYNFRETITYGGTPKVTDGVFRSGTGYVLSSPENVQSDFENRSYRLLAPFPGLSVLLDPDLCQEQVNQGKAVFGGSCDDQVSAFINLILKILIGAAAVLLVLRIMFEGYKYIVSDIPRLKTNAKSGLWDAVLGLVLALSSFLILNTLNPKLLENTIKAERLEIGIEEALEYEAVEITSSGTIMKVGKVNYKSTYKNNEVCLDLAARAGKIPPCGKIETISVQANGKYVEKLFSEKLKTLGSNIKTEGLNMTVTEAMPSSRNHKNECHKNGRCIDIDFIGNQKPDASIINSFIKITNRLGMCAIWEATPTEGKSYYNSLEGKVLRMEKWANVQHAQGAHFSLYNGTCK